MQDNDNSCFVGRLTALTMALEPLAPVASGRRVRFTATDDGAIVAAFHDGVLIERQVHMLSATGAVELIHDDLTALLRPITEERRQRTQDRRCFAITANGRQGATLSIDGTAPVPIPWAMSHEWPDSGPPVPTRATVTHRSFMHAVPRHLAHRLPAPVPANRLAVEITQGNLTVVAQDRHATIVTPMRAETTQVAREGNAIELPPHIVCALRHGNRDGYVEIGWPEDDRGRYRVVLRSGALTMRMRSLPVAPLTSPIVHVTSPARVTARFRGDALRTMIETIVQDYAEELHVSDATLAVTLSPGEDLALAALRGGEPDVERGETLKAEVNGPQTTVRVAASRLQHALDQLDARSTTLRVSGSAQSLVLTERDETRVLVVPQAH